MQKIVTQEYTKTINICDFCGVTEEENRSYMGVFGGSSVGDKWATFIVRDLTVQLPVRSTSDDLPPLEEYLKDPEATQSIDLPDFAPINAFKTQAPKQAHKDGQTMGMCFKIACDKELKQGSVMGHDLERVESLTRLLYAQFQKLMSE